MIWEKIADRENTPLSLFHPVAVRDYTKNTLHIDFSFRNYLYYKNIHYFSKEEFKFFRERIIERLESDKNYFKLIKDDCYRDVNELLEKSKVVKDKANKSESLKYLKEILDTYLIDYHRFYPYLYVFFPFDEYFSKKIIKGLGKKHTVNNLLGLIGTDEDSYSLREEKDFLKIAILIKETINNVNLSKIDEKEFKSYLKRNYPNILLKINEHINKYDWLASIALLGKGWRFSDFINRAKQYTLNDLKEKLNNIEYNKIKRKNEYDKVIKEIKPSGELSYAIDCMRDMCQLRSYKQDVLRAARFNFSFLLKRISKELSLEYMALNFLLIDELNDLLTNPTLIGKVRRIINKRKKGFALLMEDGRIKILTGQSLKEFDKLDHINAKVKEVNGEIACKGYVMGKVKIIRSEVDFKNVESGDIIIAPMTRPSYITIMEKISGLITNEGGLTSHASIISRELDIPCLVGTKIATKVFNNGDLIELDANKGFVKLKSN